MVGRTEEAKSTVRLRTKALLHCLCDPRLANARLAGNQDDLPIPLLGLHPAAQQKLDVLVATDERRRCCTERLEPALHRALPDHPVGFNRGCKALHSMRPRSSYSNKLPSSRRVAGPITTVPGAAAACSRAARFGVSPTTPRSCDSPDPISWPTTTRPVSIPTRTSSGAPALVASFGTA